MVLDYKKGLCCRGGERGGVLFQGTGEKMKYNPGMPALSNP